MHEFNMGGSIYEREKNQNKRNVQTNDMKSLFGRDKQNSESIFLFCFVSGDSAGALAVYPICCSPLKRRYSRICRQNAFQTGA